MRNMHELLEHDADRLKETLNNGEHHYLSASSQVTDYIKYCIVQNFCGIKILQNPS